MTRNIQTPPHLVLRVQLRDRTIIGPGKAELLERIDRSGSISAAAREMGMSYRQAWLLLDTVNAAFGRRVIETSQGGRSGGGTRLTALGRQIVARYRAMQMKVAQSTRDDLKALSKLIVSSDASGPE